MKCEILTVRGAELDVSLIPVDTKDQLFLESLEKKGVEIVPYTGDGGLYETCVITLSRSSRKKKK